MGNATAPPLCLGTAGHVDHGKTWLVKALTGKDTDPLAEEKRRGISIELGYAPLELAGGRLLSVVDVPGHERFVRTMVAGATGIDLFLLVVDATEGPRSQTHEHLAILRLLGIDEGLIAVTKADLVDPRALARAVEAARALVPGAEVVAVSAQSGMGLGRLRNALEEAALRVQGRRTHPGATRLFVDRSFTLRGIGTVATGTLWAGSVERGDVLRVEPGGLSVRVRSVQVHDRAVERAEAGQRVAVALPGVKRSSLQRGDALVEPGAYPTSYRLDVILDELEPVGHGLRVQVHHGTAKLPARVVRAGTRFAQLRLARPAVAARHDRVVLRTSTTLAGGRVLDPVPPRHADTARFERLERGETPSSAEPIRHAAAPSEPPRARIDPEQAVRLEAELAAAGVRGLRVEDRELGAALEAAGRLVRLGDGFAVSVESYELARQALVEAAEREGSITLSRFRDLLGVSRRPAQLLLERFDLDRLTRRVGDARVLRRAARQRHRD